MNFFAFTPYETPPHGQADSESWATTDQSIPATLVVPSAYLISARTG